MPKDACDLSLEKGSFYDGYIMIPFPMTYIYIGVKGGNGLDVINKTTCINRIFVCLYCIVKHHGLTKSGFI